MSLMQRVLSLVWLLLVFIPAFWCSDAIAQARGLDEFKLLPQLGNAAIGGAAISHNGRFVATSHRNGELILWDTATTAQITRTKWPPEPGNSNPNVLSAVAFSPDDRMVAVLSENQGTAYLWDVATFQTIRVLRLDHSERENMHSVVFSSDGKWIVTCDDDKYIQIWNASTGDLLRELTVPAPDGSAVKAVALSADRRILATASMDYEAKVISGTRFEADLIRLWDTSTGELIRTIDPWTLVNIEVPGNRIESLSFCARDKQLLVNGQLRGLLLFDIQTSQVVRWIKQIGTDSVACSSDGRFLAMGGSDYDESGARHASLRLFDTTRNLDLHLPGHQDEVTQVAFSADGRQLLSASADASTRLWNTETGDQDKIFHGSTTSVTALAVAPSGKTLLIGDSERVVHLWDLDKGKSIQAFRNPDPIGVSYIATLDYSRDEKSILTAGATVGAAQLLDASTGNTERTFHADLGQENFHSTNSAFFSPDNRYVLSFERGSMGPHEAWLWDAASGAKIKDYFLGDLGHIAATAFSPDGRLLATVSDNDHLLLWDASSKNLIRWFPGYTCVLTAVAFSADGKSLLSGCFDGSAILSDVTTGKKLRTFKGNTNRLVSVAMSADGKLIAGACKDGSARVWETAAGKLIATLPSEIQGVEAVLGVPQAIAFDTDSQIVVTSTEGKTRQWNSQDGQFVVNSTGVKTRRWNAQDGRLLGESAQQHTAPSSDQTSTVALSRNGHYLLSSAASEARLIDTVSGKLIATLPVGSASVRHLALSEDGRSALVISSDGTLRVWDTRTGKQTQSSSVGQSDIDATAIAPNGKTVASGHRDGSLRIWDATSGATSTLVQGGTPPGTVARFVDNDSIIIGGSDGSLRLLDRQTGSEIRKFPGLTKEINAAAVSVDSRLLLAADDAGEAKLWDISSGKSTTSLPGNGDPVIAVAISPGDHRILTATSKQATLWDTATGHKLWTTSGTNLGISSVAFTPDGNFALTGDFDTTTRLLDAKTGAELAALMSYEDGSWAVVSPNGLFDSSNLDCGAGIYGVLSSDRLRPLPMDIFMREYYTPGLLARILKGESLPEVRSIAEIKNRVQPEVSVVRVVASAKVPGRVDVVVRAKSFTDEKAVVSGLEDLRLFRDGQMVAGGYLEGTLKDGEFTFRDVMLPSGAKSVTFTAYAFNSERIKSATASLEYVPKPAVSAGTVTRRAFLVQIGVNHYAAEGCELNFSVNDAEKMSAALSERMKARGLMVEPVVMTSEKGGDATGAAKEAIRRQLAAIAAKATPDDVFFLSFSGHGYSAADGQFYILPSDVKGSCHGVTEALLRSAISADELAEWLRPIDAGEMTFVLDACHSAESVEANGFKPGPMGSRGLGQLAYDKRMRILAASQSDATAQEYASLQQGLLSYVLTHDGLQEGKADWKPKDGAITLGEWLGYAANAVPAFTLDGGKASGSVNGGGSVGASKTKGIEIEGQTGKGAGKAVQVPAIFDFSKKDTFRVQ